MPAPIPPPPVVNGSSVNRKGAPGSATFRLNAQVLFLTFPQCETSKEQAMENLLGLYPDLDWAIIAQEAHQDGTPHLHLVTRLAKKTNIRNSAHLDQVAGQHGNYQSAKKLSAVLRYVRKSDEKPLEHGPVPTALDMVQSNTKIPQGEIIFEKLKGGIPLREIVDDHPAYSLINLPKMKTMKNFLEMTTTTTPSLTIHCHSATSLTTHSVVNWFRLNLSTPREFKQPQLWLWGPANTRKTSAMRLLRPFKRVYDVPHEEFDDFYADEDFDVAFLDEFTPGCRKVDFLKLFLQGDKMSIRVKGHQALKTKIIPVVICSNFCPDECFTGKELEAMLCRLKVVEAKEPLDLDSVIITPDPLNLDPLEFECRECSAAVDRCTM